MWCRNTELSGVFDALPEEERGRLPVLERIVKERVGLSLNRRTLVNPDECSVRLDNYAEDGYDAGGLLKAGWRLCVPVPSRSRPLSAEAMSWLRYCRAPGAGPCPWSRRRHLLSAGRTLLTEQDLCRRARNEVNGVHQGARPEGRLA
jgi:hypothetical protein